MSDLRSQMDSALKATLVPQLRDRGFRGSLPHFRRVGEIGIDLFTIQFDRNGGGFVIEVARCPPNGITTHWGKQVPAQKVTAWDLHPNDRYRIKPLDGSGTDSWFRFDDGNFIHTVQQVIAKLPHADAWWTTHICNP